MTHLRWILVDCLEKYTYEVSASTSTFGSSGECNIFKSGDNQFSLRPSSPTSIVLVNGKAVTDVCPLIPHDEYFIKAGSKFYLLKGCENPEQWFSGLDLNYWIIQDLAANSI